MKILITGGHFTPAISLIHALQEQKNIGDIDIIFVGRQFAINTDNTFSLEYNEIQKKGIRFIHLEAGRLTRVFSLRSLINTLRIPIGFINAFTIIRKEKPDLVFSFGSYLGVPICFWAFLAGIPVYTHEQTVRPGLSNRFIGKFAKKVFVSFEETKKYFNERKTIVAGNLVRDSIFKILKNPFSVPKGKPVLYITGGSLGSHSINEHIFGLLEKLLDTYVVIHQLGDTKEYKDYEKVLEIQKHLPEVKRKNYFPKKHFFEEEIGFIYSVSDLVIGRAGANTFFELIALKKPALFIPLPWSAFDEQEKHAMLFEKNGIGEVFNQSGTSDELYKKINHMADHLKEYKKKFSSLNHLYNINAQERIIKEIFPTR